MASRDSLLISPDSCVSGLSCSIIQSPDGNRQHVETTIRDQIVERVYRFICNPRLALRDLVVLMRKGQTAKHRYLRRYFLARIGKR